MGKLGRGHRSPLLDSITGSSSRSRSHSCSLSRSRSPSCSKSFFSSTSSPSQSSHSRRPPPKRRRSHAEAEWRQGYDFVLWSLLTPNVLSQSWKLYKVPCHQGWFIYPKVKYKYCLFTCFV